jgi:hypothetical protein
MGTKESKLTTYTVYQISNASDAQVAVIYNIPASYQYERRFEYVSRTFTLKTNDANLVAYIDGLNVTGLAKSTITVNEYDDSKTITQIISIIQSNGDTSNIRSEILDKAKKEIQDLTKVNE